MLLYPSVPAAARRSWPGVVAVGVVGAVADVTGAVQAALNAPAGAATALPGAARHESAARRRLPLNTTQLPPRSAMFDAAGTTASRTQRPIEQPTVYYPAGPRRQVGPGGRPLTAKGRSLCDEVQLTEPPRQRRSMSPTGCDATSCRVATPVAWPCPQPRFAAGCPGWAMRRAC